MKLNLGCGRSNLPGYVNIDRVASPGVDLVADLSSPLPFKDDSIDEMLLLHVIEHIPDALALMQELHRVAKPGTLLKIAIPYGSSDDAWEDPTHVRPYFLKSFSPFAQPYYWRADYGYRGDWRVEEIALVIVDRFKGRTAEEIMSAVSSERNVVMEMLAKLVAVKPIRAQERDLMSRQKVVLLFE